MFKRCCLLSVIFCANQLSAEPCPLGDSNSPIGRYQISSVETKDVVFVYLLDTQTGTIWVTHQKRVYSKAYYDWTRLPPAPQQNNL